MSAEPENKVDYEVAEENEEDLVAETLKIDDYVVPEGAVRVRVTDATGKTAWRKIEEYVPGSDTLYLEDGTRPIFMFGRLGRPSGKGLHEQVPPSTPLIRDLIRIKASQLRNDPLSSVVESTPDASDVLNQIMIGLAEETASLRFERMDAERRGEDSSPISIRRVTSLKALADTWLKRKEQVSAGTLNIESPAFIAVLRFVSETFVRAMEDAGIRSEQIETVTSNLARLIDDQWKTEAKNRIKGAI